MTMEARGRAEAARQRAQEAETHPERTVKAAELQARSLSRIADALEKIAEKETPA